MNWRQSLAPLRERNFAWYYASRIVSTAGSMMAGVALAFAVLEISDSATALGQVLAARTIPMVIFLLWGGVIADRISRALILQVSNLLSALTQGSVAYLVLSGQAELWMVIALVAINGVTTSVSMPAMAGVLPQLVPRDQLQQANVLVSMSRGALTILGPTVAALLVVTVGSGWALAFDASTWLLASLLITRVRLPARQRSGDEKAPGLLGELREGWSLFTGTRWLWIVVAAFAALNAIQSGALHTLGPPLAKETFGAAGWGYALSAQSIGLLVVTIVLLRISLRHPLRAGMIGASFLSIPLLILGLDPVVVPLVVAMFVAGAGGEIFNVGWSLAMQENIDERMLSRAYSYDMLGSFVAMPIGQLMYGPLGEIFGYRDVLVISAITYAAICLAALSSSAVRNLGRVPAPETPRP